MRVLLAGATGAIGRPLIRGLKQHGHSVFGLVRSAESTHMLTEMGAEALIGDALDAASAPEPLQITEQEALATSGADSVYYATRLRGASNEKARHDLNFRARPLDWLQARAVPAQRG